MMKMLCHCHKAKSLLQCKGPMSQHMVQCIAVDTDILQAELEWCSHQEKAHLNHLLYRSSERKRELSLSMYMYRSIQPEKKNRETTVCLQRTSSLMCVVRDSYRSKSMSWVSRDQTQTTHVCTK